MMKYRLKKLRKYQMCTYQTKYYVTQVAHWNVAHISLQSPSISLEAVPLSSINHFYLTHALCSVQHCREGSYRQVSVYQFDQTSRYTSTIPLVLGSIWPTPMCLPNNCEIKTPTTICTVFILSECTVSTYKSVVSTIASVYLLEEIFYIEHLFRLQPTHTLNNEAHYT